MSDERERRRLVRAKARRDFGAFLAHYLPELSWHWPHLVEIRRRLARVTAGGCDRLGIMLPPQHGKTRSVTVPYPVWRMVRTPGLRAGVCSHSQRYANKISRWCRKLAVRAGEAFGEVNRADEWEMANGSTFVARGRGASIAGEPLDLLVVDDVFGSRQDADSAVVQEEAYEWYMDDVTPRLQKDAPIILVNTRWGPGDLYGRIERSEEGGEWEILRLPAIAESDDPLGREPGEALCPDRFPLEKLLQKRRVEGVGFESLYQCNPVGRDSTTFEYDWLGDNIFIPSWPEGVVREVLYLDPSSGRDSKASDFQAYCRAGFWPGPNKENLIVLECHVDKVKPVLMVAWGLRLIRERRVDLWSYEVNGTMGFLQAEVEKQVRDSSLLIPTMPVTHGGNEPKEWRIRAALMKYLSEGRIKIVDGSGGRTLRAELQSHPNGSHDDCADAAAGAIMLLSTLVAGG